MRKFDQSSHTFVVCAYMESPYLEECICSVLNQTVKTQVIITTSTPNKYIYSIAEKYKLPVFVNSQHLGIAVDWNFAFACVNTELLTLTHQDDVYEKEYAEKVLNALNESERPLIVFSDYNELRNGRVAASSQLLTVKRFMLLPLKWKVFRKNRFVRRRILSFGNAICCPSVTFVKDEMPTPLFKNNMKSNIDWQAWEEISRLNGEFIYIPCPLMKHRLHGQSTTSELLEVNGRKHEDLYMFRKFWPSWIAGLIARLYQMNEKANSLK